jgi:hypothetical protein
LAIDARFPRTLTRQKKQAAMCIAEERAKISLNTRKDDGLMSSRSDAKLSKAGGGGGGSTYCIRIAQANRQDPGSLWHRTPH